MAALLTMQDRDFFARNGYLIAPFQLDPILIDQVIAETLPHYQADSHRGSVYAGQRIQDAWRTSPAVRQLALEPQVLKLLKELYGRRAFAFQTLNFQTGTQQLTHSDTIHFNSLPSGFMAGVWVALEDVDTQNGALQYFPGSHLLPEVTMQDVGVPAQSNYYRDYERFIGDLIVQKELSAEFGIMKKGQVFVWHANLLHGGGPHPDKSRTRHSQVSHYFFSGCRYYTPMLSTAELPHWRDPLQISAKLPYGGLDSYRYLRAKPSWLTRWWRKLNAG